MHCIPGACAKSPENVSEASMNVYTIHQNSRVSLFTVASPIFFSRKGNFRTCSKNQKLHRQGKARQGRLTPFTRQFIPALPKMKISQYQYSPACPTVFFLQRKRGLGILISFSALFLVLIFMPTRETPTWRTNTKSSNVLKIISSLTLF